MSAGQPRGVWARASGQGRLGKGVWEDAFQRLAETGGPAAALMLDATHVKARLKARRSAASGKGGGKGGGGAGHRPLPGRTPTRLHLAGYDSRAIRSRIAERGGQAVIPNYPTPKHPTRKHPHPFDRKLCRQRTLVGRAFCRLEDWRRIATRYDRLARTSLAAVALASIVICWI